MIRQFTRSEPLQAFKLAAILIVLFVATAGIFGYIPSLGLKSLFLIVVLGLLLGLVVIGETLIIAVGAIGSRESIRDQIESRPTYIVIRTLEVACVILPAGGFVYLISTIPEGPMAGPGAIGLLFIITGLGTMPMAGSLIRVLSEVYYFRQDGR